MDIGDIIYHRPQALKEACELGRTFGHEGRFLAGGTELLVDFQRERDAAKYLISLAHIPDLKEIQIKDGMLCVGAMATMSAIAQAEVVHQTFPVLSEAAGCMGNLQIRNKATIGGNFSRAVPCADTPPICIAAGAQVRLVGAEAERLLPAADFFAGPRETALLPGELQTECSSWSP